MVWRSAFRPVQKSPRNRSVVLSLPDDPNAEAAARHFEGTMVPIPGGSVLLSDARSKQRWMATVDAFCLGRYPVTKFLYEAIVGQAALLPHQLREPVTGVSWDEAVRFCNRLSELSGLARCYDVTAGGDVLFNLAAGGYRLPLEAEWEHACRAGTTTACYGKLEDVAWYAENSAGRIHEVGLKQPNAWGVHDMLGNVWEWCWDHLDPDVYRAYRVFRGGGWADQPWSCRASCRRGSHPSFRIDDLGFRVARSTRP